MKLIVEQDILVSQISINEYIQILFENENEGDKLISCLFTLYTY